MWDLTSAACERYRAARMAQNELQVRDTAANVQVETPEFLDTNDETAAAAAALRWWQVAVIDWQVARATDFWPRLQAAEAAGAALQREARRARRAGR